MLDVSLRAVHPETPLLWIPHNPHREETEKHDFYELAKRCWTFRAFMEATKAKRFRKRRSTLWKAAVQQDFVRRAMHHDDDFEKMEERAPAKRRKLQNSPF